MEDHPTHSTFVVGFDGSERGADALVLGELLADAFDGSLVLAVVHRFDRVIGYPAFAPVPVYDFEAAAREQANEIAARGRELCRATDAVEVRVIGSTSAGQALYELADDVGAAAIVVGSSHRAAIGRITPGSVGESLLSGSPCAVAVAPAGFAERQMHKLVRIGVAYDESLEATHALAVAERAAARLHASLTVLSVCERPEERDGLTGRLERVVREVPPTLQAVAEVRVGKAADQLAQASNELDLLVCGSRRYGPLRRVLLGSVSARLIRAAACPVVVLPRDTRDPLGDQGGARPASELPDEGMR